MDIPQHDCAALSMLTQAADAMGPIAMGPISISNQIQNQNQNHMNTQHHHLGEMGAGQWSSGRIQGIHVQNFNGQTASGLGYHSEESSSLLPVLSARSMEAMGERAFQGVGGFGNGGGNGNGRGYFNTQHANLGASGYGNGNGNGSRGVTGNGNGMQILDAESYDDGRGAVRDRMDGEERVRSQREVVMPFGITDAPRLSRKEKVVEVVETGGPKKKRKTKHKPAVDVQEDELEEEEEGEAGKKARGRPRVDTKDETPAERRRTQIRLAQRAYRNRKETTISSLEKKVQDLRGTNEEMSNIFINLYDFVVSKGILGRDPELAHQFQNATERFVALAKSTGNDDSNPEENGSDKNQKHDSADADSDRRTNARKTVSRLVPAQEISPAVSEPTINPWGGYTLAKEDSPVHELGLQFAPPDRSNIQVISRPTEDNASFPFEFMDNHLVSQYTDRSDIQVISRPTEDNASFPFDLMGLQQYRAEVPPMDNYSQMYMPTSFPPPPTSFSFSEISFARRIHRSTTEAALKLASMPNPPAVKYQRVFGITAMYESKDAIVARLKRVLDKSSKETLQQWKEPFLHLGGSGTFYPMPESERNSHSMPKFQSGYSMGPFSPGVSQVQELVDEDMRINLPAFRSDFFDSNDVEGYLRSRGIEIPPAADFVSVEIDLNSFSEIASRRNSSTPDTISPRTPHNFVDDVLLQTTNTSNTSGMDFSKPVGSNPAYAHNYWNLNTHAMQNTSSHNMSPEFDPMTGYHVSPTSHSSYSSKSVVTINVKTFVEELISRCVCLGRAPGYRPNDVNAALMAAIRAGAGFPS